ncbi:MAG: hypothetical protein J6W40_00800 [Alphaproteobacteria bacterium]|nr:hypothetical protein [Alphaproteobacteria bacterium]
MFDDAIIVQSAISAFNNAALVAPAFLWSALLTLPLYLVVWVFGDKIADYLRWSRGNITMRAALWTVITTIGWVVLFGGNYGVLRDDTSTLPFMIAAIIFVASIFVGSYTRDIKYARRENAIYIILVLLALGLSDMHAWWGPILQIGAAFIGFVIGRRASVEMPPVPGVILISGATVTSLLMQPEYFRFGQLGNLTWVHLLFVGLFGIVAAATVAVRNINTRGRIHHSAYIKLKWMVRFVVALGVALFVMTESVPVFLGTSAAAFVLVALSVWHAKDMPSTLGNKLFALAVMLFGILITMPVITAIGIVYMVNMPKSDFLREIKQLL